MHAHLPVRLLLYCLLAPFVSGACSGETWLDAQASTPRDKRGAIFLAPVEVPEDAANGGGHGQSPARVPAFALKDACGVLQIAEKLYKDNGMLLMLTVPNLTQYEKQKRWEKWLRKEQWPAKNAPRCVVLQDLSQQDSFKDKIRKMMSERQNETPAVLFVLDEDGDVRRRFGVSNNETIILLVDSFGRIVHHERDDTEPDRESARRVVAEVRKLAESRRPVALARNNTPLTIANRTGAKENP
jgi:hypothetical protein